MNMKYLTVIACIATLYGCGGEGVEGLKMVGEKCAEAGDGAHMSISYTVTKFGLSDSATVTCVFPKGAKIK